MKPLAITLLILAQVSAAGSQSWRVLQHRETITLDKGPPISFPAGVAVCSDGRVPAVMDLQRGTFRTAGCPPLIVFSGGFE